VSWAQPKSSKPESSAKDKKAIIFMFLTSKLFSLFNHVVIRNKRARYKKTPEKGV
jgi:hypothetical protein